MNRRKLLKLIIATGVALPFLRLAPMMSFRDKTLSYSPLAYFPMDGTDWSFVAVAWHETKNVSRTYVNGDAND